MPLYDYTCTSCDHTDTVLVSFSERDDFKDCPKCGATAFKRNAFTGSKVGIDCEPPWIRPMKKPEE